MNHLTFSQLHGRKMLSVSITILLAACGGSGDSPTNNGLALPNQLDAVSHHRTVLASSVAPLPVPTVIANGSTVSLQCGQTYFGTLNLVGKSNVTVNTLGTCGKAAITPASRITGWTSYQGNIYSAPIGFTPQQVSVNGTPVDLAHWPNKPQTWANGTGTTNLVNYTMPNTDLIGAVLVFRANEWAIEARTITGYAASAISLASTSFSAAYDGYTVPAKVPFYVKGKLWMLDSPGEWAVANGRLYVWAADGLSPEGKVWAAPIADGIDARNSSGVTIDGVNVFNATNGINGASSSGLKILNTDIANSADDGIYATASKTLVIDKATIRNSAHNAMSSKYQSTGTSVTNSTVNASGMLGMPEHSRAAINFSGGSNTTISNNTVTNSAYIGIRVYKAATVSANTIDGACLVLTDCGGIYTFARDKLPSNVRIEGNTIKNLTQRAGYAVYLDDYANGVTVTKNIITNNPSGILVHNGFNNIITYNTFSSNAYEHVFFSENGAAASIKGNQVFNNTFVSTKGELSYRMSSIFGNTSANNFGTYDYNSFTSSPTVFAYVTGSGTLGFTGWKTRMVGQDTHSTLK